LYFFIVRFSAVITTSGPSIIAGMNYTLDCSLNGYTGSASATIKWRDDDMRLVSETCCHAFNPLRQLDNGTYTCIINIDDIDLSQTIALRVEGITMTVTILMHGILYPYIQ
jgi:hypothetical protein